MESVRSLVRSVLSENCDKEHWHVWNMRLCFKTEYYKG